MPSLVATNRDTDETYVVRVYVTSTDYVCDSDYERTLVVPPGHEQRMEDFDEFTSADNLPPSCANAVFVQLQWVHEQDGYHGLVNIDLEQVPFNSKPTCVSFLNGTVTVAVPTVRGDDCILEELEKDAKRETDAFSSALHTMVTKTYDPIMPEGADYTTEFARSADLFSALMKSSVHPSAFFEKKWILANEVLENLARLALHATTYYDGRALSRSDVLDDTGGKEARLMRVVLLSRFLAMYANTMPYMSDVEKRGAGAKFTIGEWFGDMVLNQAGDCEDASRVACQVWYNLKNYKGDDALVLALQRVSKNYDLYACLCTVLHLGDMAHMTAFLYRKNRDASLPRALIVEGTNMVDPFGPEGGAPGYVHYDEKYATGCKALHVKLPKFLTVVPKRTQQISGSADVVDGRAGGSKRFYGVAHNVYSCSRGTMHLVGKKGDDEHYGCSFEDIAAGNMKLIDLPADHDACKRLIRAQSRPYSTLEVVHPEYHPFFDRDVAQLVAPRLTKVPYRQHIGDFPGKGTCVCIPAYQFNNGDLEAIKNIFGDAKILYKRISISCPTDTMYVFYVPLQVQKSIKGRIVGGKTTPSTMRSDATEILAPFVGHRGPIYACDPLYAAVSARYSAITGDRIRSAPNVCIREQIMAGCGKCAKHHPGDAVGGPAPANDPDQDDHAFNPDDMGAETEYSSDSETESETPINARVSRRSRGEYKPSLSARIAARFVASRAPEPDALKTRIAARFGTKIGAPAMTPAEEALVKNQFKDVVGSFEKKMLKVYDNFFPETQNAKMKDEEKHRNHAAFYADILSKVTNEISEKPDGLTPREIDYVVNTLDMFKGTSSAFKVPFERAMETGGFTYLPSSFWSNMLRLTQHHVKHADEKSSGKLQTGLATIHSKLAQGESVLESGWKKAKRIFTEGATGIKRAAKKVVKKAEEAGDAVKKEGKKILRKVEREAKVVKKDLDEEIEEYF